MAKTQTLYFCQNCGAQSVKWMGRCSSCGEWNSLVEEVVQKESSKKGTASTFKSEHNKPMKLVDIPAEDEANRINTGNQELNRVLGGGLVAGSVVLVGGEPGIGKSTLLLQFALQLKHKKLLYISGEESARQISMRAERTGSPNDNCYILTETKTQDIFLHIQTLQPEIIIVDSIQTLTTDLIESSAGSISQIRECAAEFQKFAKLTNVPVFLIGHITKDGAIAGPKILEHMVDVVLQFEGDRNYGYRILRSVKNRFGSTSELGIFEMSDKGLREVSNPSEILLSQRDDKLSGTAIASTLEGLRPMLIEIQALVGTAAYGTPQRSSTGFELRRLGMLLAVLEKRCGFRLGSKDVFLNIAGGIRVDDPAIDLAVICAILSSNEDIALSPHYCFAAEVGLTGEIRPVNRIEQRIAEADKLGFEKIFISKYNAKGIDVKKYSIEIQYIKTVVEVFKQLF